MSVTHKRPFEQEETMTSRPEPMTATQRRALKIWQVLIARASNRQTITYGELARVIGNEVPPPALGRYLDLVADFCQVRGAGPDLDCSQHRDWAAW